MGMPENVKTDADFPIPETMKAWVLGDPGQLTLEDKPVPIPVKAEVLVRIDAVAICATDLEIVLKEGRNREIRRLLARLGHKVQKLVRIAVGPVRLGDLPRGAVRPLTTAELRALRRAADPARGQQVAAGRGADHVARKTGGRRARSQQKGKPRGPR